MIHTDNPHREKLRRLEETTHLHPHEIESAQRDWHHQQPMRRILEAEIKRAIEELRNTLETCDISKFQSTQGQIAGHRAALAIIRSQHTT